jgi:hypothetical protein
MKRLLPVGILLLAGCGPEGSEAAAVAAKNALLTLGSGTTIQATTGRAITYKAGETLTATVTDPVKDGRGRVVIPAGSTLHLRIAELEPARDKSAADGKISVTLTSVTVGGRSFDVEGQVTSMAHSLKGRGVGTSEVGKTAAGAVVGGVAGRVIGGNATGTVVGAVVGGAAGAAVAVETANRDVVVPSGTPITVTLRGPVTVSFQ